jgi:hypothetical protein
MKSTEQPTSASIQTPSAEAVSPYATFRAYRDSGTVTPGFQNVAPRSSGMAESFGQDDLSTESLFRWVESKLHLLKEMQALSLKQQEFAAQQDLEQLMVVLSKKQSLVESLQHVQGQLLVFQSQNPDERVWQSSERRQACRDMINVSDQILQQLIVMENRSLDNMVVQREIVASQLQQNAGAALVQHAYQNAESQESLESFFVEG